MKVLKLGNCENYLQRINERIEYKLPSLTHHET